jgi:hypothetical protein
MQAVESFEAQRTEINSHTHPEHLQGYTNCHIETLEMSSSPSSSNKLSLHSSHHSRRGGISQAK